MGNHVAKKSQTEKKVQKEIKDSVIRNKKAQLATLQGDATSHSHGSGSFDGGGRLVTLEQAAYLQTAQAQLDRGGKPLTKADLVAIVTTLQKGKINPLQLSSCMSVEDLNVLIRSIIYDSNHIRETIQETIQNSTQAIVVGDSVTISVRHSPAMDSLVEKGKKSRGL